MQYIEITPEMLQAGIHELRERSFGEALGEIVKDVFIAMCAAIPDQAATDSPPPASVQREDVVMAKKQRLQPREWVVTANVSGRATMIVEARSAEDASAKAFYDHRYFGLETFDAFHVIKCEMNK